MAEQTVKEALASAKKVLVGLGEEWKWKREAAEAAETAGVAGAGNAPANSREALLAAYEGLYEWIKDTDYFIVTMATDGLIFETPLGSQTETVVSMDASAADVSCPAVEGKAKEVMDRLFPAKEPARREADTRIQRIVAPCGNENWQQCSQGCTKDIWEPGEVPDGICPHCGAPLTGNTVDAETYIEEGYLPQWQNYTRWLAGTLNRELLILELGEGFQRPTVIRWPFERTAACNQKARFYRVNQSFAQLAEGLAERAVSVHENSVEWLIREMEADSGTQR